jgi:hypothetical protein
MPPSRRSCAMADSSRMPDGLDAALAICLGVYSFVAACFALALYALLQPSTSPNPGLAVYDPPPRTVITYAAPARLKGEPETDGFAAAAMGPEPAMSAPDQPTKEAAIAEGNKTDAKKEDAKPEVKAQTKPRRTATRQRERQSPRWDYGQRWDYAAQPSYNNYRPWF